MRKIELNENLEGAPKCIYTMTDAKVNGHCFDHYMFEPVKMEFEFYNPKVMRNEVIIYATVIGTVITDTTICLKITEIEEAKNIEGENEMKIFGYVIDYIAKKWYTVWKETWYGKWKKDPKTKIKASVIAMKEKEVIVSFGV